MNDYTSIIELLNIENEEAIISKLWRKSVIGKLNTSLIKIEHIIQEIYIFNNWNLDKLKNFNYDKSHTDLFFGSYSRWFGSLVYDYTTCKNFLEQRAKTEYCLKLLKEKVNSNFNIQKK